MNVINNSVVKSVPALKRLSVEALKRSSVEPLLSVYERVAAFNCKLPVEEMDDELVKSIEFAAGRISDERHREINSRLPELFSNETLNFLKELNYLSDPPATIISVHGQFDYFYPLSPDTYKPMISRKLNRLLVFQTTGDIARPIYDTRDFKRLDAFPINLEYLDDQMKDLTMHLPVLEIYRSVEKFTEAYFELLI